MNILENTIKNHLTSHECKIISPWMIYQENWWDTFNREKINRKIENLEKLTMSISKIMKEILGENISAIYVDCEKKWKDDIMVYILKVFFQHIKNESIINVLGETIWENSTVINNYDHRIQYINQNNLDIDWIFDYYMQIRDEFLKSKTKESIDMIMSFESDITFRLLKEFIEDKTYIYMYLDNTKVLEKEEKKYVNRFLYSRWSLWSQKWIHLKINNWERNRDTRTTSSGHRVESPHDYSDHLIYEKEVE